MHKALLVVALAVHPVVHVVNRFVVEPVGAHVVYPVGHYLVNLGHEDNHR